MRFLKTLTEFHFNKPEIPQNIVAKPRAWRMQKPVAMETFHGTRARERKPTSAEYV